MTLIDQMHDEIGTDHFDAVYFTDGGGYGVLLEADADVEFRGDAVLFNEEDALYVEGSWDAEQQFPGSEYSSGLYFNAAGHAYASAHLAENGLL